MCISIDKRRKKTAYGITAYKVVRVIPDMSNGPEQRYVSEYEPWLREPQSPGAHGNGKRMTYAIGEQAVSPSGPGIYTYSKLSDAVKEAGEATPSGMRESHYAVLRLRIPRGAYVARGRDRLANARALVANRAHVMAAVYDTSAE